MKCLWKNCGGQILRHTGRCFMCGRTRNTEREERIDKEKAEVKTDWQISPRESDKNRKLKRKYS